MRILIPIWEKFKKFAQFSVHEKKLKIKNKTIHLHAGLRIVPQLKAPPVSTDLTYIPSSRLLPPVRFPLTVIPSDSVPVPERGIVSVRISSDDGGGETLREGVFWLKDLSIDGGKGGTGDD